LAKVATGETFRFFSLFGQEYQRGKFFVFSWSFLAKVIKHVSFWFSWSFLAKDNNGESFWFWAFLAKDTSGESFVFFLSFWPRIATVKVLFSLVSFGQGYQRCKFSFFLGHFWPRLPKVKVFVFLSFLTKDTNGESFCFFGVILGQGYQWWKFLIFEPFWPRIPTVKAFFFLCHFWPSIPMVKVLVGICHFWPRIATVKLVLGLGHFWPRLPTVKDFVFHGYFWSRLLLLATSAMNTNDESYVCDLRFWTTSGILLCQTRVRVSWRQSLAPHCASRS